jgi:hypothetical protein
MTKKQSTKKQEVTRYLVKGITLQEYLQTKYGKEQVVVKK